MKFETKDVLDFFFNRASFYNNEPSPIEFTLLEPEHRLMAAIFTKRDKQGNWTLKWKELGIDTKKKEHSKEWESRENGKTRRRSWPGKKLDELPQDIEIPQDLDATQAVLYIYEQTGKIVHNADLKAPMKNDLRQIKKLVGTLSREERASLLKYLNRLAQSELAHLDTKVPEHLKDLALKWHEKYGYRRDSNIHHYPDLDHLFILGYRTVTAVPVYDAEGDVDYYEQTGIVDLKDNKSTEVMLMKIEQKEANRFCNKQPRNILPLRNGSKSGSRLMVVVSKMKERWDPRATAILENIDFYKPYHLYASKEVKLNYSLVCLDLYYQHKILVNPELLKLATTKVPSPEEILCKLNSNT